MSYQQEKFAEIADAIREKTGTEDLIKPSDLAGKISEVYEKGLSAGEKSQYDEFWDTLQNYGNLREYTYAFYGVSWKDKIFNPKYDFAVSYGANSMFQNASITSTKKTVNISNSTIKSNTASLFNGAKNLVEIPLLKLKEDGSNNLSSCFGGCNSLTTIAIEGTIGKAVSFADCPLSVESVMSVLTHLKNYSGSETTPTLTLSTTSKNLMSAQGEIAELDGKTYDAYITDKGWNLA